VSRTTRTGETGKSMAAMMFVSYVNGLLTEREVCTVKYQTEVS
jgi:hypothetical protein